MRRWVRGALLLAGLLASPSARAGESWLTVVPEVIGSVEPRCEVALDAERGDMETVVTCRLVERVPDWRRLIARLCRRIDVLW